MRDIAAVGVSGFIAGAVVMLFFGPGTPRTPGECEPRSVPIAVPASLPNIEPERVPPPDALNVRKGVAIRACETDGGVVAMGFGFSVVCIPESAGATSTSVVVP